MPVSPSEGSILVSPKNEGGKALLSVISSEEGMASVLVHPKDRSMASVAKEVWPLLVPVWSPTVPFAQY